MKKWILRCLMITFCWLFPMTAFAQETGDYDSKSVTTFYGSYEKPEEDEEYSSDAEIETDLANEVTAGSTTESKTGGINGSEQSNAREEKTLPQTGSENFLFLQVLGVMCFSMGLRIIFWRSRRKDNTANSNRNFV